MLDGNRSYALLECFWQFALAAAASLLLFVFSLICLNRISFWGLLFLSFVILSRNVLVWEVVLDFTEMFNVFKQVLGSSADLGGKEAGERSTKERNSKRGEEGGKLVTCLLMECAISDGHLVEHDINCCNVFVKAA